MVAVAFHGYADWFNYMEVDVCNVVFEDRWSLTTVGSLNLYRISTVFRVFPVFQPLQEFPMLYYNKWALLLLRKEAI